MLKAIGFLNPNYLLRNLKIRNKITLSFSIMIFLFVSFISYFSYYYSTKLMTDKSIVYTLEILEQISSNIDNKLKQIDMTSLIILNNTKVLNVLEYGRSTLLEDKSSDLFNVDTVLFDVMYSRNDIESICLFDLKGMQWNTISVRMNLDFEAIYKKAQTGEGKMVFLETNKTRGAVPAVRQVRNMSIEPVGMLMVNIKESSINKVFSNEIGKMQGKVYVIDEDSTIISCSDSELAGTRLSQGISDKLNDQSGYVMGAINNEESIITYYPSKYNKWKYIAVIPLSAITAETAYIGKFSTIAFCVVVILFIPLTYVVASGITVPIRNMAQYMKGAKIKGWSPKMNYVGNDEIAYLSDSFNEMVDRINHLINELNEQNYRQKKHELQALQAQINPHFLYNTLEIVNCMALVRNAPEIGDMVKTLASMMRYSMNFKESIVTVEMELQHVKNYLYIQNERYRDKLSVDYDIDDRILDSPILKLTLQPIAENAVIHAFKGIQKDNAITISGTIAYDKVRICIIDNGRGMDEKTVNCLLNDDVDDLSQGKTHTGIGIGNVNRRLKLTFGEEYGLVVASEPGRGTKVEIWLPIEA